MNVKALRRAVRRAKREIEENNGGFNMAIWARRLYKTEAARRRGELPCGTICCLAGFSLPTKRIHKILSLDLPSQTAVIGDEAISILDLSGEQAYRLFHMGGWPLSFYHAYYDAAVQTPLARPCTKKRMKAELAKWQVLKDRVEHFIATNGEE